VRGGMHLLPAGAVSSSFLHSVLHAARFFAVTSFGAAHGSGFAEESAVVAGAGVAAAGAAAAGVVGALGTAGVADVTSVDGVEGAAGTVGAAGTDGAALAGSVGTGFEPPHATAATRRARQSVFMGPT